MLIISKRKVKNSSAVLKENNMNDGKKDLAVQYIVEGGISIKMEADEGWAIEASIAKKHTHTCMHTRHAVGSL